MRKGYFSNYFSNVEYVSEDDFKVASEDIPVFKVMYS